MIAARLDSAVDNRRDNMSYENNNHTIANINNNNNNNSSNNNATTTTVTIGGGRKSSGSGKKKGPRNSSSSNVLSVKNDKKPGSSEQFANVNKAFINFVNNTFDDLKRKNKKPTLQKSLSKENERISNVPIVESQKSSSSETDDDLEIEDALEDLDESDDFDTFDDIVGLQPPLMDNVKCSCTSHPNRELLNRVFNLSYDTMFQCLFTRSEFMIRFWREKKFRNVEIGEWSEDMRRVQLCELDIGTFGTAKNHEEQRMIENKPNQCFVIESETSSTGVMYSDYFSTTSRVCMTRVTATSTRLYVNMQINWKKQPNFVIKNLIDKSSFSNMKDCYSHMEKLLLELSQTNETINVVPGSVVVQSPQLVQSQRNRVSNRTSIKETAATGGSRKHAIDRAHSLIVDSSNLHKRNDDPTRTTISDIGLLPSSSSLSSSSASPHQHPTSSSPSSDANLNVCFMNIFKWRVRQDTFFKLVLILFLIIVAINIRLYLKLVYAENKMETLRINGGNEAAQMVNCGGCHQNMMKSWRSLVTNSLQAIRNVETFLKDWEERFGSMEL